MKRTKRKKYADGGLTQPLDNTRVQKYNPYQRSFIPSDLPKLAKEDPRNLNRYSSSWNINDYIRNGEGEPGLQSTKDKLYDPINLASSLVAQAPFKAAKILKGEIANDVDMSLYNKVKDFKGHPDYVPRGNYYTKKVIPQTSQDDILESFGLKGMKMGSVQKSTLNMQPFIDEIGKHKQGGQIKSYNPNLAKDDNNFQNWYNKNTVEGKNNIPYSDKGDYDYYSYYKNGDYKNYEGGHFPDTFKRPIHETFSNQSIYSTPENPGGTWNGDTYSKNGKFIYKRGGKIRKRNRIIGNEISPQFHQANDANLTQGPFTQPNGMQFNFGGTVGSILSTAAPLAGLIPGVGLVAAPLTKMIGDQLQRDNQPKMKDGGTISPYITHNPNDSRIQAYKDSLDTYNSIENINNWIINNAKNYSENEVHARQKKYLKGININLIKSTNNDTPVAIDKEGNQYYKSGYSDRPVQPIEYRPNIDKINLIQSQIPIQDNRQLANRQDTTPTFYPYSGYSNPNIPKGYYDLGHNKKIDINKMKNGGMNNQVDINVEGYNKQQGPAVDMQKGELLVKNGKVLKNYIARPPHPDQGLNPEGNVTEQENSIVIPKNRTKEYMNTDLRGRKMIEKSLVSQQDWRANKAMNTFKKGGLVNPKMYIAGGEVKCDSCNEETLNYETNGQYAFGGDISNHMNEFNGRHFEGVDQVNAFKSGGWIGKAAASIKHRGTEGKCTPMTKPGCTGRALALAKTFHKIARNRKHEDGGEIYSANIEYQKGGLADSGDMMFKYSHPAFMYGGEISEKTHPMSGSAFAKGGNVSNTQLQSMHGPIPFHPQVYPSRGGTINPGTGQRQIMHYPYNKTGPAHYFANGGSINGEYDWNLSGLNPNYQAPNVPTYQMDQLENRPISTNGVNASNNSLGANRRTNSNNGGVGINDIMSYAAPAYNFAQGLFGKPKQLNSNDYKINIGAPKYIDTRTGQRDTLSAYRSGKQDLRGNLPATIEQNSQYQGNESNRNIGISNLNSGIYNQWLGQKLGADQANAESKFRTDDWNVRSNTMKDNFLAKGFGELSSIGQNNSNNQIYSDWYKQAYPDASRIRTHRRGGKVMNRTY